MTIKKIVELLAKLPQDAEAAMPSVLGSGLDEITDIEFDEKRRLVVFEFEPRKRTRIVPSGRMITVTTIPDCEAE